MMKSAKKRIKITCSCAIMVLLFCSACGNAEMPFTAAEEKQGSSQAGDEAMGDEAPGDGTPGDETPGDRPVPNSPPTKRWVKTLQALERRVTKFRGIKMQMLRSGIN